MDRELLEQIKGVVLRIEDTVRPKRIVLFNQKLGVGGRLLSFKLCVVVETEDKRLVERQIYVGIDCDIPFDIVIYTPDEWQQSLAIPHSFARTIDETGCVVYE